MFGLLGLNDLARDKATRERRTREREARLEAGGVPWTLDIKWSDHLTIKAATWPSWRLFDVEATDNHDPNFEPEPKGKFELSPSGDFMYCEKRLGRGETLTTALGSRSGDVMFDQDIVIPALHERARADVYKWRAQPWMSLTPMELLSQRPGLRFSKGHTIVAGLGIGWFLMQCRAKRTVRKVTLVEKSQELVDWLLTSGRIAEAARIPSDKLAPLEVIVGDAYEVIPKLKADVAVIDIYEGYGGNDFLEDLEGYRGRGLTREERQCSSIGRVWNWGKAYTKGDGW